ncbi:very short patch repair endonuclease [Angustibacter aerolatus]
MPEQEPARVAPGPELHRRFSRQRRAATAPEVALRRELHARGRRYRVQARIEGLPRRRVDLVFTRWRLVVLVDGCFWHGCPVHGTMPKANREWWTWKLANNARRDADTDARLTELGWTVLRLWEHVPAGEAADAVEQALVRLGAPAGEGPDPASLR